MASKLSAPNMPRLLMVKLPLLYSSGASALPRARLTRSDCTADTCEMIGGVLQIISSDLL